MNLDHASHAPQRLARAAPLFALAALIAAMVAGNLLLIERFPTRKMFGDENQYARYAQADSRSGWASLLPGRLRFTHRPSLHGHVLSQVGPAVGKEADVSAYRAELALDVRYFNIGLTSFNLIALYALARLVGLGAWVALLPPLLLATLPRVVFHIHGLWSETLHMLFEVVFFAATCATLRGRSPAWLALGGVSLGFAVLTRQTLLYFLPVAALLVAWAALGRPGGRPYRRALLHAALLTVGAALVIAPQYIKNHNDGHGFRLAANSWRNIEYGLIRTPRGDPEEDPRAWREHSKLYHNDVEPRLAANRHLNRELHSKRRTLAYLKETPAPTLIARQWRKLWEMLLLGGDTLHIGVERGVWGADTQVVARFAQPDIRYWQALVWLSLLSIPLVVWRNRAWAFLVGFVAYYLLAFAAVSFSGRLALQLAPAFCVMSVGGVWALVSGLRHGSWRWSTQRPRRQATR
jgi:hypothetical protein